MQFFRTLLWIVFTALLVAFVAMNWETVTIRFWPLGDGGYRTFEAPGGLIAIIFFFLGLLPVWTYYRGVRWQMRRKVIALKQNIRALEDEKASAIAAAHQPASADREASSPSDFATGDGSN